MRSSFPLFPDSASTHSGSVDALFIIWSLVSIFFTLLIGSFTVAMLYLTLREDYLRSRGR